MRIDTIPLLNLYGCERHGFIKAKWLLCSPINNVALTEFSATSINIIIIFCTESTKNLLKVRIKGMNAIDCAYTVSVHCIAGEILYHLQEKVTKFKNSKIEIILADKLWRNLEVCKNKVFISIESRSIRTSLSVLLAKNNRTLFWIDFLKKSGIALDVANKDW